MSSLSYLAVGVLAVMLLTSTITSPAGRYVPVQSSAVAEEVPSRNEVINSALSQDNLFDCATYDQAGAETILPAEQKFLEIVRDEKITDEDSVDYTGARWSPDGKALVIVAPTAEKYREMPGSRSTEKEESSSPIAVSVNKLFLYSLSDGSWQQIAADGASPVWSADGKSIYYLLGTDLMKYEVGSQQTTVTGLQAANTSVGLLLSHPLPDGQLLASPQLGAPVQVLSEDKPASQNPIELTEADRIFPSPTGQRSIVAYGAASLNGEITPAITALHDTDGAIKPLMQNCQYSAHQVAWSSDGSRVAYPVHAAYPEIWVFDVNAGETSTLLRWNIYTNLSGLSWSPDNGFLAFAQGDRNEETIWIASTDGKLLQSVTDGLRPNWSPDGSHILYARRGKTHLLDWNLLEISVAQLKWEE